ACSVRSSHRRTATVPLPGTPAICISRPWMAMFLPTQPITSAAASAIRIGPISAGPFPITIGLLPLRNPPHPQTPMMKNIAFAIAIVALTALSASADSISIGASKDVTIFQNNVDNSSGGGNGLFAGTNGTSSPRRALLAFDIAGNVPAGAVIQGVQL